MIDPRAAILSRPRPPPDLLTVDGLMRERFVPDPALLDWVRTCYLTEHGPLYDPVHSHLDQAKIGVLWTNVANSRQMRRIVGQAELVKHMSARNGTWTKARSDQQLSEWFGDELPDFVLTFDAVYADQAEDAQFCALVDHELCHAAQEIDEFGSPRFDRITGLPKFAMRGHDVEEFVSVVRRFGIEAAGQSAVDFVIAAAARPEVAQAKLAEACGTCVVMRLAA